jgi:hypothetical protein
VQQDCAVRGAAHPRIRDADHVLDAGDGSIRTLACKFIASQD